MGFSIRGHVCVCGGGGLLVLRWTTRTSESRPIQTEFRIGSNIKKLTLGEGVQFMSFQHMAKVDCPAA